MDCYSLELKDLVGELGIWAKSWQEHLSSYKWKKREKGKLSKKRNM